MHGQFVERGWRLEFPRIDSGPTVLEYLGIIVARDMIGWPVK